jgi:hypothetical protein
MLMANTEQAKQPAQVPGDAESPPQEETDRTAERAIRHADVTEPVQSEPKDSGRKPA